MKAVWLFSKENHQRSIQLGCISKGHAGAVMGVLKQWKASSAPYLSSVSLRESSAVLFPVSFSSTWINLTFIWYCQKYCINIILTPTVTRWKFWVYLRGQDNKVGGKLLQIAMDKEKLSNSVSPACLKWGLSQRPSYHYCALEEYLALYKAASCVTSSREWPQVVAELGYNLRWGSHRVTLYCLTDNYCHVLWWTSSQS